jgi:glycosyltransferase involved in cell wall biosynthesis
MDGNTIKVYYVNKYSWLSDDPMAACSTMLLYALAKTGVQATLIAEGDQTIDHDAHLQKLFSFKPIPEFRVRLFRRKLFNRVKCTPWFYLCACIFIIRNRGRKTSSVVISRNTTVLPWLVALKRLFGVTVLFESHAYHGEKTISGISNNGKRTLFGFDSQFQLIERLFLNACDGLVCQSSLQQDLYKRDFVKIPIASIPLGSVVPEITIPDNNPTGQPVKKKIAYIGNLFGYVDIDLLFDALSLYPGHDVTLLWIGLQESEHEQVRNAARARGIESSCELRGWMTHQEMIELMRREAGAGIVLYKPSLHTSAVVSPTKIFDYFAAGLPVIGPDMPSVSAYVHHGSEGAIYEPGNPRSLVKAMETVFENETNYREMKVKATEGAAKSSWENRAKDYDCFIKTLV